MLNPVPIAPTQPSRLPALRSGDRLTRAEFHRRYTARPDIQKAELIEGVVYVAAAARFGFHGRPDNALNGLFFLYAAGTPGVEGGGNTTILLDDESECQPDGLLRLSTEAGGQSRVDEDTWLMGGPELVGEVAADSATDDVTVKLEVYLRHGVREYLVWRVIDSALDWFMLRDGQYERLAPDEAGVVHSEVFPGLWIDVPALLRGDFASVVKTLNEGLASTEHAEFCAQIQARVNR